MSYWKSMDGSLGDQIGPEHFAYTRFLLVGELLENLQCSSPSSILEGHACLTQVHFQVCSQAIVCVSCVG